MKKILSKCYLLSGFILYIYSMCDWFSLGMWFVMSDEIPWMTCMRKCLTIHLAVLYTFAKNLEEKKETKVDFHGLVSSLFDSSVLLHFRES